ncbi:uncharacterized protein LOC123308108 [Coccinella septempunctata]|uniref:uncharacterized protein LOC123308108 n=1 Tax=Coccinella septempunctata TaxID=41139 RepID=UPI001D075B7B|nr:uncharacterized protein LOC123308108 [Coccinella septempunctata]
MPSNEVPQRSALTPKRLRFSSDDDLALLREFLNNNPLKDAEKWETIQKNVFEITGKNFKVRTLKDHVFLLLKMWKQKDTKSQKSSGVEEVYSERDQLLQEIADICRESEALLAKRKRPLPKEKQIAELGKKARDSCLSSLQTGDDLIHGGERSQPDHDYITLTDVMREPFMDTSVLHLEEEPLFEVCVDANSKEGPEMSKELPLPAHESEKGNKEAGGNMVKPCWLNIIGISRNNGLGH